METPALRVSRVVDLAVLLQQPLIFFDIETTTLRGRPNFGVWECAFVAAVPAGAAVAYHEVMDPERPLDAQVRQLCGITDAELKGRPTIAKTCLPHFIEYAPKAWFGGFNIRTFDVPAIKDMAERYEQPVPDFQRLLDVRQLHHAMLGTGTQKGTLEEIARSYDVAPNGALHRAPADVALTIETFDAQLGLYGPDAVLQAMNELNAGKKRSRKSLSAAALAAYVQQRGETRHDALAKHFACEEAAISFEIGKAIDERLISADVFAAAPVQHWLDQALPQTAQDVLAAGKLRGILDALRSPHAPTGLDYIQLRVALLRNGVSWNTLKAA